MNLFGKILRFWDGARDFGSEPGNSYRETSRLHVHSLVGYPGACITSSYRLYIIGCIYLTKHLDYDIMSIHREDTQGRDYRITTLELDVNCKGIH